MRRWCGGCCAGSPRSRAARPAPRSRDFSPRPSAPGPTGGSGRVGGRRRRLASLASRQPGAAITVFLAAAVASWLNWGFGLVVGALVAREIAKRLRDVDFGFLVAAAYMGFMVWASGLSSSIALATATHGSALNIVEKVTGKTAGFDETIFTAYNLVP